MDNHHVNVTTSYMSCGVAELSKIDSDIDKVLYALASQLYHPSRGQPAAFVAWSDMEDSNGAKLAKEIFHRFKTEVLTSILAENPKTSNWIKVWVWEIPHEKFREWYRQRRVTKAKQF